MQVHPADLSLTGMDVVDRPWRGDWFGSRLAPWRDFEPTQEIFLAVHEFVRLSPLELDILDHPVVQRLRHLQQLGFTELVYPDATHSRLSHALGTLHVAQLMIERLNSRLPETAPHGDGGWEGSGARWVLGGRLSLSEVAFIRLTALLHDVAQVPFGHTLEDELGLRVPHDHAEQLRAALELSEWDGEPIVPLGALVDAGYRRPAEEAGLTCRASEALVAILDRDTAPPPSEPGLRWEICSSLVTNTLCADLLDYVHRDLHHLGMPQHFSTRLLEYLEIRRDRQTGRSKLVLCLGDEQRRRSDAVTELIALLQRRHQLYEIAYYHRTKLCAGSMLGRALTEWQQFHREGPDPITEDQSEMSPAEARRFGGDQDFLRALQHAVEAASKLAVRDRPHLAAQLSGASRLVRAVRRRVLHAVVLSLTPAELRGNQVETIKEVFGGAPGVDHRRNLALGLEHDLGLPPGSITVFCLETPKLKLAEADVLVHDVVRTLEEHERAVFQNSAALNLTSGMLQAMRGRFQDLWRFIVTIDRSELARLDDRGIAVLTDIIRAALGVGYHNASPEEQAADLAVRVARHFPSSPLAGQEAAVRAEHAQPARGDLAVRRYPGRLGLPRLTETVPPRTVEQPQ